MVYIFEKRFAQDRVNFPTERQALRVNDIAPEDIHHITLLDDRLQRLRAEGVAAIYRMDKEDQRMLWLWSQSILARYSRALRVNPNNVRHVSELPHPKSDIKLAIQLTLLPHGRKKDDRSMEILREHFLELASFQEIAARDRQILMKSTSRGKRPKQLFSIYSKYAEMVATERIHLLESFNAIVSELKKIAPRSVDGKFKTRNTE